MLIFIEFIWFYLQTASNYRKTWIYVEFVVPNTIYVIFMLTKVSIIRFWMSYLVFMFDFACPIPRFCFVCFFNLVTGIINVTILKLFYISTRFSFLCTVLILGKEIICRICWDWFYTSCYYSQDGRGTIFSLAYWLSLKCPYCIL